MGSRQERELNRQVRWSIIEIGSDLIMEGITQAALSTYFFALIFDLPDHEQAKTQSENTKEKIFWFKRGGHD